VQRFVELGTLFWLAFLAYWSVLWFSQHQDRHRTTPLRYEELRNNALMLGLIPLLAGVLLPVLAPDLPMGESLAIAAGVAVGLGHFFVFPAQWWRGRRSWFWKID